MDEIAGRAALKEWASVVSALHGGEQIVLLRKGGIADRRFETEASRFFLFPTYLHQKEKQFKPEGLEWFLKTNRDEVSPSHVEIDTWAEVIDCISVKDLGKLERLDPFVIFTRQTIEERYRFRPDQAVQVLLVRAWNLPVAVPIRADRAEYHGCLSWIRIEEEIPLTGSTPAIGSTELAARVAEIRSALAG